LPAGFNSLRTGCCWRGGSCAVRLDALQLVSQGSGLPSRHGSRHRTNPTSCHARVLPDPTSPTHPPCPTPRTPHPTPNTPYPTPYNRHPTPYTLQSTPYTLHPTPFTLHPTTDTLNSTPYTLHPLLYILHPAPFTLHPPPLPYTLNDTTPECWRG